MRAIVTAMSPPLFSAAVHIIAFTSAISPTFVGGRHEFAGPPLTLSCSLTASFLVGLLSPSLGSMPRCVHHVPNGRANFFAGRALLHAFEFPLNGLQVFFDKVRNGVLVLFMHILFHCVIEIIFWQQCKLIHSPPKCVSDQVIYLSLGILAETPVGADVDSPGKPSTRYRAAAFAPFPTLLLGSRPVKIQDRFRIGHFPYELRPPPRLLHGAEPSVLNLQAHERRLARTVDHLFSRAFHHRVHFVFEHRGHGLLQGFLRLQVQNELPTYCQRN